MRQAQKLYGEVREVCEETLSQNAPAKDVLRECLQKAGKLVMDAHFAGAGGEAVCRANAIIIDEILRCLYKAMLQKRKGREKDLSSKFCLVALGGYGRGELSPKSDIDLLVLYADGVGNELKTVIIDEFLYPLWDTGTGIKLGHSSRTLAEALEDARSDILLRNSMIDSRLICGSRGLYEKFSYYLTGICRRRRSEHFDELMRLKRDRHEKFGWTPYLQEPNIKNGVGGLRDFQTMAWKARLNFGRYGIRELARRGIISLSEYREIRKAHDFLLRVRNDMHYRTGRALDLLDLETQMKIAPDLGFGKYGEIEGVEEFMRKLYFSLRTVDTVAKAARKRMGIVLPWDVVETMRHMGDRRSFEKTFYIDGFRISKGVISARTSKVFKADPTRLIKVFAYCQRYGAAPNDRLEVLINDSRRLITDAVRNDEETNDVFLGILKREGDAFQALEQMHYWGVLSAFVPQFHDITCMVQHEFYHRYTADVHILNTIAQLDKVFRAGPADGDYWEYHKVITETQAPALAYLMLFLHDIGKGDGIRGHAEVGAEIGAQLLRRFDVPESESETILFIVRYHLEMARFWQSQDVEDDRAIARFAEFMQDEDKLKYLYVITFCDSMGTTEGFWNSYKQSLHSMLYKATLAHMRKTEDQLADSYEKRRETVLYEALSLPESDGLESLLHEHVYSLPRNYFAFHGRDDVLMHVKMIRRLMRELKGDASSPHQVLEWRDDPNRSISRLCVVSTDRSGLFAMLAGVLTLSGLNILASKILTRSDGITVDTFYVNGIYDGVSDNERFKDKFSRDVKNALSGSMTLETEINRVFYEGGMRGGDAVGDVAIRKDGGKLILEVRAPDRVGLLYKLARRIQECGYDIAFARINTEGKWAQDAFHLKPGPLAEPPEKLLRNIKNIF